MRPFEAECESCGMLMEVTQLDKTQETFKKKPVKVFSYTCPKCDRKHISAVYDEEADEMREQLRQVHSNEERTAVERSLYWHNKTLKKAYIKDVRKHGQK